MGLCNDSCCNDEKRAAKKAEQDAIQFLNRLEFFRREALARGQTVDRVVPAEPMVSVLLRSNEPEKVESDDKATVFAPRCECHCPCDNIQTVSFPRRCRECAMGKHIKAA